MILLSREGVTQGDVLFVHNFSTCSTDSTVTVSLNDIIKLCKCV